jgi:hypothetical protein
MFHRPSTLAVAAVLAAVIALGNAQPARADGAASTRNIILGAGALAAGIIISNNVAHKRELANTVAGYTPDGATVYADGRVVYPDGRSYYPNDNNQSIACRANTCTIVNGDGSGYRGYNRWNGTSWVSDGAGYTQPAYAQPVYAQPAYATPGYANAGYATVGYANGAYASGGSNEAYREAYNVYLAQYREYLREYDAYVRNYYAEVNRAMAEMSRVRVEERTIYVRTTNARPATVRPATVRPATVRPTYTRPFTPPAPPRPFCCDPNSNPATDGRH